jgi:hypothetical protein
MRFQLAKMRLTIRLARSPPASKRLAHVEPFLMSNGLSDLPLLASRKANSRHGSNWFAPTKSAIPPQTAGANIPAHVGQFFETRSACLRRFVGGTFPFAKTHKHLDTRLSEPARSHIAARLQAAGPSHEGPPDWIERRGSMPRVIPRSDT